MAQTRIFISHSHHDNEWCRAFAAALTAIGYDVWFDEAGLQGGDAWVASIQREVQSREIFVIVLTPEAWESQWVQDELQLAIATRRRILPVLLRNTQVSGFLLATQWITVIGEDPQAAARAAIPVFEAPPAPGRNAAPQAATETLDDLVVLCRSLAAEERFTEALSACNRALALDPKNVEVLKIKVGVLHAVGDTRLEGRAWFELLLADPEEFTYCGTFTLEGARPSVMWDSLNEEEVVHAYTLVGSAKSFRRYDPSPADLEWQALAALVALNRLDAAIDLMTQVGDERLRNDVLRNFRGRPPLIVADKGHDLAVRLIETWYGFPPQLNTPAELWKLELYAKALADIGRVNDARTVRELIVRIFEGAYGDICRRMLLPKSPPWAYGSYEYKLYLPALEAIGRAKDAERLRKAYPYA